MTPESGPRPDPWSAAAVEQNRQWMTAYVLSLTGDPGAADDLVQEAFTIAFRKRGSFEPGTNFGGWLRGIARNVTMRHLERRSRRPLVAHDEVLSRLDRAAAEAESRSVDPGWIERRKAFLRECLRVLSESARMLIEMRYREGRPSAEVATVTGQTVSAVNVAVFRARLALAECVRGKERGTASGGRP